MTNEIPAWARRGRGHWKHTGAERPPFAVEPGPRQESVWDYPRPPRLEEMEQTVEVRHGDVVIASTDRALRIVETASAPTVYLPPDDVAMEYLRRVDGTSRCEWKGEADYWSVVVGSERLDRVGWSYPDPFPPFEAVKDHLSFYPAALHCTVGGERVRPQPGGFYGGWVTDAIVGPIKGEPGSGGW